MRRSRRRLAARRTLARWSPLLVMAAMGLAAAGVIRLYGPHLAGWLRPPVASTSGKGLPTGGGLTGSPAPSADGSDPADAGSLPRAALISTYENRVDGYAVGLPAGWRVEAGGPPVQTLVTGPGARLSIFVQDVSKLQGKAEEYVLYGNKSVLQGWNGLQLLSKQQLTVAGHAAWLLRWRRPALQAIPEDENEYREYDLVLPGDRVATLMLKATPAALAGAAAAQDAIAASWQVRPVTEQPQWHPDPTPLRDLKPLQSGALQWRLPAQGALLGVYDERLHPVRWHLDQFQAWEQQFGGRFGVVMTYQHFPDAFPTASLEQAARDGRLVFLTLQSWHPIPKDKVIDTATSLTLEVLDGRWDDYLHQYARAAAAWGRPFLFRLDNEMNSDWVPWGAYQYGKDAELYRLAWRHVWQIFHDEGASNAIWVWNPNGGTHPDWQWNHESLYWPGGQYVDLVGLTAYNFAGCMNAPWLSFGDAIGPAYAEYARLYPGKPLVIPEFASHDAPGDQAAWLRQAFSDLKQRFPAIKLAVWWNGEDRGCHMDLGATPALRSTVRTALADPYFADTVRFSP